MNAAPARHNESDALAALHRLDVLDSTAEAEFDALVQAASAVCGTPISLVSLVDAERQWFKANIGLPGATQTSREIAFCAHAVLGSSLFEVPDAREDERFFDNPLVTGDPNIRFYAGVPLQLSGGEQVGTLCVIDRQPRHLTAMQREVLACLGVAVARALEGRRAMREMARVSAEVARAALVEEHSADAIIGTNSNQVVTRWNRAAEALFGYSAADMVGRSIARLMPSGQADDVEGIGSDRAAARALTFESVRRHSGGAPIHVSITAVPEFDGDGRQVGLTEFVRDISGRVLADQRKEEQRARARRMYELTPSMLHSVDREGRLIAVSDVWLTKLGYARAEVLGRSAPDLLTPESRQRSPQVLETLFANGRVDDIEYQLTTRDGRVLDVLLSAVVDHDADGEAVSLSVMQDVTEQRQAERALSRTRKDLQNILDAVPSMIGYWDCNLTNRVANRAYAQWFGVDPGALRNKHMRDLLGDELFERNRLHVEAALRGETQVFERAIPRPDGQGDRHSLAHYLPEVVDGEVLGFYVLVHDITPIKQAQQQADQARQDAEAAERFLREVTDRLPLGIAYVDHQQRVQFANEVHCQRMGHPREQIIGRTRVELTGLPKPASAQQSIEAALQGTSSSYDIQEGGRTFETNLVPDLGPDGRVAGYFAVTADITERRASETELRRTLTLLHSVLEASTQVSIIAVELDGKISMFNRGAEQLLGYTASEVVGTQTSLMFHDPEEMRQRAGALTRELGRKVHTGMALVEPEVLNRPHEWTYIRRDGARIPVSLAVTAMRDGDGALVGYLGVAHDISGRIQYEISLREALQKARAASQAKSQFLANMSHEIRTPMNAVIGLAYLLERTRLNAEQADTLSKIKLSSQSLLSIINDVLDLSKIEASEMQIEQVPFALDGLLSEVASLSRMQADLKGISFEMHSASALPATLQGDAMRLRQVLSNLLSNAIKFTERGQVQLCLHALQTTAQRVRLRFEVKDSGVGIAPEALPKLFSPFVQADSSTTRRFGGTGLGLSIVKQLVTLMGGEVGVDSVPQQGSTFWVELELTVCGDSAYTVLEAVAEPSAGPGLAGVRVLIADDSPINLEVARRILELEGAKVSLANNGHQAVDHLLANPEMVDVVLMDVQMPVLDGHDATRRIRSGLGLKDLPIIALTAGITTGERERAQAAGMNDVLAKPFDPPALVRCIRRYVAVNKPAPLAAQRRDKPYDWPQIDGIDADDVRARLGGDVSLLRSLLQRLINDFSDIGETGGAELAELAGRLHNLKGSAGTLAAKSVERLAAKAEEACRAGRSQDLKALVQHLAAEITALRTACAALMLTPTDDASEQSSEGIDGAAVRQLLEQLHRFDLAAVDGFKALSPFLRPLLGPKGFATIRQQLDNLQFDLVASAIEAHATELNLAGAS
jgi:PAS domain S-box-containing protein